LKIDIYPLVLLPEELKNETRLQKQETLSRKKSARDEFEIKLIL